MLAEKIRSYSQEHQWKVALRGMPRFCCKAISCRKWKHSDADQNHTQLELNRAVLFQFHQAYFVIFHCCLIQQYLLGWTYCQRLSAGNWITNAHNHRWTFTFKTVTPFHLWTHVVQIFNFQSSDIFSDKVDSISSLSSQCSLAGYSTQWACAMGNLHCSCSLFGVFEGVRMKLIWNSKSGYKKKYLGKWALTWTTW